MSTWFNPELKMDKFNLNYSLKNIPVGSKQIYYTRLYDMASKFINRLRWKAYHFRENNEFEDDSNPEEEDHLYQYPVRFSAPPCDDLARFEDDLFDALKTIKFRRQSNAFQDRLKEDIKKITSSEKVFVPADKTGNMYTVSKNTYDSLVAKAVHKDYKKAPPSADEDINKRASGIINSYKSANKKLIPKYERKETFITIKDHKPDFPTTIKCRLINPAKTHIGKACKGILDRINGSIREKSKLQQWKNTTEVINWFEQIAGKENKCFIKYDIVDFYPSISPKSINAAIKFARGFVAISPKEEEILFHCCDTILFYKNEPWMKRGDDGMFDVPMGSLFGAELCELIGLLILSKIGKVFQSGMCGLYRDDGLAVTRKSKRCNLIKTENQIRSILKETGFRITIESGLAATDFLDVNLDLVHNTYSPYKKPNSRTKYVDTSSNHPPHVLKAIPKMVHGRLCRLSKDENAFDNNTSDHLNELRLSGHKVDDLGYKKPERSKRSRKRKVIYFHPPFCNSVRTNLSRVFRHLVKKHFNPAHRLFKILNKNTIKVSYSCLPNVKDIISAHNKKILRDADATPRTSGCNCRNKNECPLDGHCLADNIIYKAVVSTKKDGSDEDIENFSYIGSTSLTFKKRFYSHKSSFSKEDLAGSTELSKFIWSLKRKSKPFTLKWEIINKSRQSRKNINFCTLCNLERLAIAFAKKKNLLNRRNELIARCPHNRKLFF